MVRFSVFMQLCIAISAFKGTNTSFSLFRLVSIGKGFLLTVPWADVITFTSRVTVEQA